MAKTKAPAGKVFAYDPSRPLGPAHAMIDAYLSQCMAIEAVRPADQGGTYIEDVLVEIHRAAAALITRCDGAPLLHAALERIAWLDEHGHGRRGARHGEGEGNYLHTLVRRLVERHPGLTVTDLFHLLTVVNTHVLPVPRYRDSYHAHWYFWLLLKVLPYAAGTPERISPLLGEIRRFLDWGVWYTFFPLMRHEMLAYADVVDDFPSGYIGPGEGWADTARIDLRAMDAEERAAWQSLFASALGGEDTTAFLPPPSWTAAAAPWIDAIGRTRYADRTATWFARLAEPGATVLCDQHALILRTLLWGLYRCAATPRVAEILADVVVTGYSTVPAHPLGHKPKGHCSTALGRAGLAYLERNAQAGGMAALRRIAGTPPSPRAHKAITATLARAERRATH